MELFVLILVITISDITRVEASSWSQVNQNDDLDIMITVNRILEQKGFTSDIEARLTRLEGEVKRQAETIRRLEAQDVSQQKLIKSLMNEFSKTISVNKEQNNSLYNEHSFNATVSNSNTSTESTHSDRNVHADDDKEDSKRYMSSIYKDASTLQEISRPRRSNGIAFSAYLGDGINHINARTIIRCDSTIINDGQAYNSRTGIFVTPVAGVYMFSFRIASYDERLTNVKLVLDGVNEVDAMAGTYYQQTMGGNMVIVRVTTGQTVWLETYNIRDGDLTSEQSFRFVTFSGVLLYGN